ncbi:hypothetical protein HDU85_005193 [Gaertneriomyces sp. JEL0708]|nr:hypothetical protein HDU85_005193 [Gaertneriomyces sp. JEL0708]
MTATIEEPQASNDVNKPTLTIAVGSLNPSKIRAVLVTCTQLFPTYNIQSIGVNAPSLVSAQPLSATECMTGAHNRAQYALSNTPSAKFAVGLEGGIESINGRHFESGWICVIDREGRVGYGTSARFEVSEKIMGYLAKGMELAEVIDELSGMKDVRSGQGAHGLITNGVVGRADSYAHGVAFAFGPFVSKQVYWN